jgi:hypothetical protein
MFCGRVTALTEDGVPSALTTTAMARESRLTPGDDAARPVARRGVTGAGGVTSMSFAE